MTSSDFVLSNLIPNQAKTVQLIQQAKAGNPRALEELIQSWRGFLLHLANRDLAPEIRAKVGASDVVQGTCLDLNQHFEHFQGTTEGEWKAWLKQLLENDLRDARRRFAHTEKRNIARERSLDEDSHLKRQIVSPDLTPGSKAMAEEEAEALREVLGRLRPEYRKVLRLRNWEKVPFAQIGQMMNCSEEAAQKLWTRAVKRLKTECEKIRKA